MVRKRFNRKFKHNVIAIVYDFDGTLTPKAMQEYTVLPKLGIKGKHFWEEVKKEKNRDKGDEITTYMRLMVKHCKEQGYALKPKVMGDLAKGIKFYPGVTRYFNRINKYVKDQTNGEVELRHYIVSAGLKEILSRTTIERHFHNIFASEYHYNEYMCPIFPKLIVNSTFKTQFLFRINKGIEDLNEDINAYMPETERAIPFQNILYIGDGLTDVPCMTVTRRQGGYAIAVYNNKNKGLPSCVNLLKAGRVNFISRADYSPNSDLDMKIKRILNLMFEGIQFGKETWGQIKKYYKYLEE